MNKIAARRNEISKVADKAKKNQSKGATKMQKYFTSKIGAGIMYGGIDIGGTSIKYGITDNSGNIAAAAQISTNATDGADALIAKITAIAQELAQKCISIGLGFPAVVFDDCVHYPPNLPGWGIVPLADITRRACGKPTALINDANAAALAESAFGAGKDIDDFLFVTLGTGIGGGIILNKKIFIGGKGGAGEIGHIIVDINDESAKNEAAFKVGTLEKFAGRAGIIASARKIALNYPNSALHNYGDNLDVEHISASAEEGDFAAQKCLERTGEILGLGIVGALAILDLRIVVVGGGVSQSRHLLDALGKTLQHRALPTIAAETEVRKARFAKHAGIIGAALAGKAAAQV
ncbi:MAG: ROK family protein [Bacteroidetes bacterium]|nr:ROK family protein [Bacteroidota bacterium]MCZ2131764.1 ROK family protein [Bacteroidota bacterium]